jgi:hypothetical protein
VPDDTPSAAPSSWLPVRRVGRLALRKMALATMTFRNEEIARLAASGWSQCPSVAWAVKDAGLPIVTTGYLAKAFSSEQWASGGRWETRLASAKSALEGHVAQREAGLEIEIQDQISFDGALLDKMMGQRSAAATSNSSAMFIMTR